MTSSKEEFSGMTPQGNVHAESKFRRPVDLPQRRAIVGISEHGAQGVGSWGSKRKVRTTVAIEIQEADRAAGIIA